MIKALEHTHLAIKESDFINSNKNTGLFLEDSFCHIEHSLFEQLGHNDGQLESRSLGGAIHSFDTELQIEGSHFESNTASIGGAVYVFLSNEVHFDYETKFFNTLF